MSTTNTELKLNLRKARKLETQIGEKINDLSNLSSTIGISVVGKSPNDILTHIEEQKDKYMERSKLLKKLIFTRQLIRDAIGAANSASGIDEFMGKQIKAKTLLAKVYNDSLEPRKSSEEILKDISQAEAVAAIEKRSSSIYVNILPLEFVDKQKQEAYQLRKELENIEDKISGLNLTTTITLTGEEVKFLKEQLFV